MTKEKPEILFVCVHNAGRSQMAAALLARYVGGRVTIRSAGSEPADQLHPAVVEAMREVGIDIAAEQPKLLTNELARGRGRRRDHGLWRHLPRLPGKAVSRLGARGPRRART